MSPKNEMQNAAIVALSTLLARVSSGEILVESVGDIYGHEHVYVLGSPFPTIIPTGKNSFNMSYRITPPAKLSEPENSLEPEEDWLAKVRDYYIKEEIDAELDKVLKD